MRNTLCLSAIGLLMSFCSFTQINTNSRWILKKGGSNGPTSYGTQGVASPTNNPNGYDQDGYVSWKDNAGNFWIFGCNGFNDLWRYEPSTNNWTWMKGSNTFADQGEYGVQGIPSLNNNPPGRSAATGWTDAQGNLWLFGGEGYTANGNGSLNDLWRYEPGTNNWTWIHGDNSPNHASIYGTPGISSPTNKPGSRSKSMTWTDMNGVLWLFGGNTTNEGLNNDLWKYAPSINEWTCVQLPGVTGFTLDRPCRRENSTTIADVSGNLWLFGGYGYPEDFAGTSILHDLWKYDVSSSTWTWVKGSSSGFATGVYGTKGVESSSNTPGVRQRSSSWSDANGNIWIFGGFGVGAISSDQGYFEDLWKFDPVSNNWTWVLGNNIANRPTIYAQSQCQENILGSRAYAPSWLDNSGVFWLFGGHSNDAFQDLWKLGSIDDFTPGIINVSANPSVLWPPNHTMRDVTISYTECFTSNCQINVTSNEAENGHGDGDRAPDWEIINNNMVKLRAERAENGSGRIYTITISCQNSSGVTTTAQTLVTVPDHITNSIPFNSADQLELTKELSIKVFPNPSTHQFILKVHTNNLTDLINVSVLDINGKLIRKQNAVPNKNFKIGQSLSQGIYLIEIRQGNQRKIEKLIKIN